MNKMNKNELVDALKEALAPLVEVMTKNNEEAKQQRESLAETVSFLKVALKSGSFESSKLDGSGESVSSRRNIRQEVTDTISQKQEFIYAQAFHRGFSFKKAQDALISGTTTRKSLGSAFDEAIKKAGEVKGRDYENIIKDISMKRKKGERVDNRNLLGLFSSYATADWNNLADDSDEKVKFFTMEHYFKNNVNEFFEKSGDSYNRVRNPSSIIKDFQRAVQKAWGLNGFGIAMDNDKTKLALDILSKSDISSYVKLYMDSEVEQIGKVINDVSEKTSEQQTEEVVETIAESDDEEPEPVVVEKPKKTTRKRTSRSKKKKVVEEKTEEPESPKPRVRRQGRGRTRKQAVVDSDSDSDSDM